MSRGNTVEVNITGKESVSEEIAKVRAALASLKDKTVHVDVKMDKNKFKTAMNDAMSSYNSNDRGKTKAVIGVNSKELGNSLKSALKDQDGKHTVNVQLDVDDKDARAKVSALKKDLKETDRQTITLEVDVDKDRLDRQLDNAIKAVEGRNINVGIDVDSSPAYASIQALESRLAAIGDETVKIRVDVDKEYLRSSLGEALDGLGDKVRKASVGINKNRIYKELGEAVKGYNEGKGPTGVGRVQIEVDKDHLNNAINSGIAPNKTLQLRVIADKDNLSKSIADALNKEYIVRAKVVVDDKNLRNMTKGVKKAVGTMDRDFDYTGGLKDAVRDLDEVNKAADRTGDRVNDRLAPKKSNVAKWEKFRKSIENADRPISGNVGRSYKELDKVLSDMQNRGHNFRFGDKYINDGFDDVNKRLEDYQRAVGRADRAKFGDHLEKKLTAMNNLVRKQSKEWDRSAINAERALAKINESFKPDVRVRPNLSLDSDKVLQKQYTDKLMKILGNEKNRELMTRYGITPDFDYDESGVKGELGKIFDREKKIMDDFNKRNKKNRELQLTYGIKPIEGYRESADYMAEMERNFDRIRERQRRVKDLKVRYGIEMDDKEFQAKMDEYDRKQGTIRYDFDYDNAGVKKIKRDLKELDQFDRVRIKLDTDVDRDTVYREMERLIPDVERMSQIVKVDTEVIFDDESRIDELLANRIRNRDKVDRIKTTEIIDIDRVVNDDDVDRSRSKLSRLADTFTILDRSSRRSGGRNSFMSRLGEGAGDTIRGFNIVTGVINGFIGKMTRGIPVIGGMFRGLSSMSKATAGLAGPLGTVLSAGAGLAGVGTLLGVLGTVGVIGTGALTAGAYASVAALGALTGIASGVTALVGGALAGAFIYFAAQAPEVSEAYSKLGENVSKSMKDMSKVVAPSLQRMAGSLQGAFDIVTPSLERMAEGTGVLVDQMGAKLPAIAQKAGPALEKMFASGATHLNIMGDALPGITESIGKFFEKMGSPKMQKASQRFWESMPGLIEKTGSAIEWAGGAFTDMGDWLGGETLRPMRQGFADFADMWGQTDWSSATSGIENAMNAFGNFAGQVEGENLSQIVGGIGDTFANLTNIATNMNLDGMLAGLVGGFEGLSKVLEGASFVFKPVVSGVEVIADAVDFLLDGPQGIQKDIPVNVNPEISSEDAQSRLDDLFKGGGVEIDSRIKPPPPPPMPEMPEAPPIEPPKIPTPRLTGSADSLEREVEGLIASRDYHPKVALQVEALLEEVTGLDSEDFQNKLGRGSRGGKQVPLEIPLTVATQIEELTGKPIEQVLAEHANGREVNIDVGVTPNYAINPEEAMGDALGAMQNLEIATKAELKFSNLTAPEKLDIKGLIGDIEAGVKLIPEMAPIVREQFMMGLDAVIDVIPNIPDKAIDNALGSFTAAIEVIPELSPAQGADLFGNLRRIMTVIPQIDEGAIEGVFSGATQIIDVIPKLTDPGQIQAALGALTDIAVNIKPGMNPGEIQSVIDSAVHGLESAINIDVNGDLHIGPPPPQPTVTIPATFEVKEGFNAEDFFRGLANGGNVTIEPKLEGGQPMHKMFPDRHSVTIDTTISGPGKGILEGKQPTQGGAPQESVIVPRIDMSAIGALPPIPVFVIPVLVTGGLAIPPIPVFVIPVIITGGLAIPPIPVFVIPVIITGGLSLPPMPLFVIPQVMGGVIIPPATVQVTPQPGAINIPVTPQSHAIMISANPPAINVPVSPSSHTIAVLIGAYTLPGNTSSTHTINVVTRETGGGAARAAFTGFGAMAGFGGEASGLYGATGAATNFSFTLKSVERSILSIAHVIEKGLTGEYSRLADGASKVLGDRLKGGLVNQAPKIEEGLKDVIKPIKSATKSADKAGKKFVKSVEMGDIKHGTQTYKFTQKFADGIEKGTEGVAGATTDGSKKIEQSQQGMAENLAAYEEKYKSLPKEFKLPEISISASGGGGGGGGGKGFSKAGEQAAQGIKEGTKAASDAASEAEAEWDGINRKFEKSVEMGEVKFGTQTYKFKQKFSQQYKDAMGAGIANDVDWVDDIKLPGPTVTVEPANFTGLTTGLDSALQSARTQAQTALNSLGIDFQIPPVDIPTEIVPPVIPQLPFIPPVAVEVQANIDNTLRSIGAIPKTVETIAETDSNVEAVRAQIMALNGANTSSTHTIDVRTEGGSASGGRGRGGFGAMAGFGEGFGIPGAAGMTASSTLNVSSTIKASMVEVISQIQSSVLGAWGRFGLSAGLEFQKNLGRSLGKMNFLDRLLNKPSAGGSMIPTLSVYEDGKLVAFELAEGIRDGDRWIIKATGELAGQVEDAVFHIPKVVTSSANKVLNGFSFGFGGIQFGFNWGDAASKWKDLMDQSQMRMSAGYLNEYGQWVVYNVNDNRQIVNQFDGGLVGDPERQAKAVVDVLGQSPSAQGKIRMMAGSGRGI